MSPQDVFDKHEHHECEQCLDGPPVCDAYLVACWAEEALSAAASLAAQLITDRDLQENSE